MFRARLPAKLPTAVGLSVAALTTAVVLQGALFFRGEVTRDLRPMPVVVQGFAPGNEDRVALVLYTVFSAPPLEVTPKQVACLYDLSTTPPRLQATLPDGFPWLVASSSRAAYGLLGTRDGDLYWLDLTAPPHDLIYLGSHGGVDVRLMQCSDDASLLVVAGDETTAWDRGTTTRLWRRTDLNVTSCAFVPASNRVVCGLLTGEVVELDPLTGATLRQLAIHSGYVSSLAISPDARQIASIDIHGNCQVNDLQTGQRRWSHRCSATAVARFSPNSQALLLSHPEKGADLALFELPSGQPIIKLHGLKGRVKEVTVTRDGTAYVSTGEGTIAAWSLSSGAVTCEFAPGTGNLNPASE